MSTRCLQRCQRQIAQSFSADRRKRVPTVTGCAAHQGDCRGILREITENCAGSTMLLPATFSAANLAVRNAKCQ